MFTGKVLSTDKDIVNNQIIIEIGVYKDEEKVEIRKFGFPYNISKKDLKEKLEKFIKLYNDEYKQSLIQKEVDKKDKNADEVINSVKDLTL